MENNIKFFKDYTSKHGIKISLIVTSFSLIMFSLAIFGIQSKNEAFESFGLFSLILELVYGVILSFKILKNRTEYQHLIPFLFLNWFIGCFCTNLIINVFENLPIWVYITTFLFCITTFFIYSDTKNKNNLSFIFFINGFSFLLILYFMAYLIPLIPFSIIGILFVGLGFYGLVPLIVSVSHLAILIKIPIRNAQLLSFLAGIITVVLVIVFFAMKMSNEVVKINKHTVTKTFENNVDLPSYVVISQNLNPNFFNEIVLKKDIVYVATDNFFEFRDFDSFGTNQYNERKTHDPLINLAFLFSEKINLSSDDRINILKSNFDKRLETEEQLWSGKDLITKNIKEDVKIYPNNRIAYTEITMDVICENNSWGQREAIYSFQLPEGSVATSLSLWVNGLERKGVLTTKEKAQQAYKQIVSIEARDPSLMQWKEGNRIVVRVFPISFDMPRTFKCGFTTPLKVENNEMKYQSLSITGPNVSNSQTLTRIQINGKEKFKSNKNFTLNNNYFTNETKGITNWEATLPITEEAFSTSYVWKENEYSINKIESEIVSYLPSEIFLDLNSSWKIEELATFLNTTNKKYFVYLQNEKQEINKENYKAIFNSFKTLHFSLLPLYSLQKDALVITKCGSFSTNFEELETSNYLKKIKSGVKSKEIRVFNISKEINPFWQTIKEQHYVQYCKIDLQNCVKLLKKNQFLTIKNFDNAVNIEVAEMTIVETPKNSLSANNGSSHIYRMYAFGKVLAEQVKIQEDSLSKNQYISLAKDANIVTPISSLLVLETDQDYKNNGIEKDLTTAGNASIDDKPATPIPHSWLLLLISLALAFFSFKKNKV